MLIDGGGYPATTHHTPLHTHTHHHSPATAWYLLLLPPHTAHTSACYHTHTHPCGYCLHTTQDPSCPLPCSHQVGGPSLYSPSSVPYSTPPVTRAWYAIQPLLFGQCHSANAATRLNMRGGGGGYTFTHTHTHIRTHRGLYHYTRRYSTQAAFRATTARPPGIFSH